MATRYWTGAVNGGTGTWDTTDTANWSSSSGGAGGASAPGTSDVAIFDANSGVGVCTLGSNVLCNRLVMTGYSGTLAFGTNKVSISGANTVPFTADATLTVTGTPVVEYTYSGGVGSRTFSHAPTLESNSISLRVVAGTDIIYISGSVRDLDFTGFTGSYSGFTHNIYGSLTLGAGMTASKAQTNTFASTSAGKTITSNGVTCDIPVNFNGVGGSWAFADAFVQGSTRAMTLTNGTLDGNGQNVSIGTFALGSGTKTLTLGSGTWTAVGASWNANTNVANLTVSASTGTISMTSGSAKTFAGGGKSWPTLNQGGAGAMTIQQSNTFADITNTVEPATITFPASTTTTVDAFTVSGTAGNLITINSSSAGTQATLSDASGQNSVSFCDIQDINATGGAIWSAFTSNGNVDSGNNTGWDFNDSLFRYIYTRRKNKRILPL